MIDHMSVLLAPGYDILNDIMDEAKWIFMGNALTEDTIYRMDDYFNRRIEEEIAMGNFRTSFVTPTNRVATYECIDVRRNPYKVGAVQVTPIWNYEDEEDKHE